MRIDPRWQPPVAAALTFFALALALAVQHVRHGWPFSLHHGLPPLGSEHAEHAEHASATPRDEASAERVAVAIDSARLEGLGVTFEAVRLEALGSEVRAVITIVPDESRLANVHTRVSGWIERLHVRTTGEPVRAGQALASIFSRELLAAQTEYLAVRRTSGGPLTVLVDSARQRLVVLGMTEAEIAQIERRGTPSRLISVTAPRDGVVLRRGVTRGAAVDPSTELFVIADLSTVWALAEIPEARIPDVHVGSRARIEVPAAAVDAMDTTVTFLYPTLSERTRTLRARFEIPNDEGLLRPGMFGSASFDIESRRVLTVPRDAIVDTGRRQHVFVRGEEGSLEPREIETGPRMGERVSVTRGLSEGEIVAASGVFVIDSESRLRATGAGTGHSHGSDTSTPPRSTDAHEHQGHGG